MASPIRTLRAGFSFGVVDAFFMGTANDSVHNHNRLNFMCFDKCDDFFSNAQIGPYVGAFAFKYLP